MSSSRAQSGLAGDLRVSVMRLVRRLRNERADNSLTLTQLATLYALARLGPSPLGELAAAERVQPPSMTRIVSSLEQRSLVERETDPDDRRLVIVTLTDEARELLAADRRRRDAWLDKRLRELTPDEREALRRAVPVLEKLASL